MDEERTMNDVPQEREDTEECCEVETTLVQDILHDIARERDRDAVRNGSHTHSGYESYSLILKLLEHKDTVSKDLKDCLKHLWEGVKQEDDAVVAAYCQEISRVARESAMAWVQVSAMADKAADSI